MSLYVFNELKLKAGEMIYIMNEKGEGISAIYENEYNSSNGTFRFSNHSNGQTEMIEIDKLQLLKRY
ncbi:hypothetical protein SAMN05444411_1295 [Lutibacter oricola]|uniref:Uncharacterized protein n=1 Tax=Lutibacter oricola TaxID=762486 RepID=A0A1H3H8E9_9FLAO|nr:hypothetical protein [Lutibacter oricola]SDY11853.1 hypothetical protein SAMN05444411_1295 [Lutibacter oricola]